MNVPATYSLARECLESAIVAKCIIIIIIIIIISLKAFAQAVSIAEYLPPGRASLVAKGQEDSFQCPTLLLLFLQFRITLFFAQFQYLRQDLTFPSSY